MVHIAWANLVRTEIRPKMSGRSDVDVYSRTARPITFYDSISGYDELMAEIRQHLNRGIEQESVACAKEPSERERRIARVVLVASWFLAFGTSMVFPEDLLWPSTANLALSLSVFLLFLICAAVLSRMTFVSTVWRIRAPKIVTVYTAAFAILFIVVAAQIRSSDLRLAVAFLVSAAICCVTGSLALRMLKDR